MIAKDSLIGSAFSAYLGELCVKNIVGKFTQRSQKYAENPELKI